LNEGQSFGCESEVTSQGEVGFIGADVRSVVVEIAEIWVRVGSCNEDACDEKSDSCDGAA
jgi:ATP-dependent protease HslVU (ClpYQ) ATPase subunit